MKTKTTMLEYCKRILQSVSFSRQLLRKEYRKSIKWLTTEEQLQLKSWVRNVMKPAVLLLRSTKSIMLLVISLGTLEATCQSFCRGLNRVKQSRYYVIVVSINGDVSYPWRSLNNTQIQNR